MDRHSDGGLLICGRFKLPLRAVMWTLRFDAADLFKTDTAIDGINWPVQEVIPMDSAGFVISWLVKVSK